MLPVAQRQGLSHTPPPHPGGLLQRLPSRGGVFHSGDWTEAPTPHLSREPEQGLS